MLRDVDEVVRLGDTYFQQILGAVDSLLFAFIYTLAQEPLMALGYLVAAPLATGAIQVFRGSMQRRNEAFRQEVENMPQRVSEMIGMVPVTRARTRGNRGSLRRPPANTDSSQEVVNTERICSSFGV